MGVRWGAPAKGETPCLVVVAAPFLSRRHDESGTREAQLTRERPIERTSGVERPSGWKAATAGMRAIRSAATFAMVQSCRRSSVQGLNDRVSTNFHEVLSNRQGALLTCSAAFFRRMSSSRFESCTVAAGSVTSLRLISIVQGNGNEKLKFLVF